MEAKLVVLLIFFVFASIEAINTSFFKKQHEVSSDSIVESISLILLFAVSQPLVLVASDALMALNFPELKDYLINIHWLAAVALFLVFDDMMQYWWHRASHNSIWLYKLHRAHHNGEYMSVRIVYRNNFFFYLFMPAIWFSGILIYLGLGWVYAGYLIVKQTVIIAAHSEWKWDKKLYQIPWLHPVMWVVERTISTPSTHSAHHGKSSSDPATHYKGNYGNLLFFWDVLFGTAKITRQYPKRYGVEGLRESNWSEQLFWPFVSAPKKKSK